MISEDIKQVMRSLALENAVKFKGRANSGAVIGPIIGKFPELKQDMKTASMVANEIVKDVNTMSFEEQQTEFEQAGSVKEEKEVKVKDLKELENVPKSGVVMRFAPSPSGPMHLGHAITGSLTSLYVQRYGGKFILRLEDTNSDNIYPPAYDLLPQDAKWLFGNVSEVIIQSDRIEKYYEYVEKFLEKDAVYVCTCSPETFREFAQNASDCPCRNLSKSEQLSRWKNMFDKNIFKQGDAVVRFKAGMENKNPALRDFPLARINDSEHPKTGLKYRVWPLMNLSVTVDDIESGMTHIIRAKDHMDNAKKQQMMYEVLGASVPQTLFSGRINFDDVEISCSKTRARIDNGEFEGWDDVRLPFIGALKRRGYQAECFKRYSKEMGVSQTDKTVSGEEFFKTINAFNKEIIDPIAKRVFFVADPQVIAIDNAPSLTVHMDFHPDNPKSERVLQGQSECLLSKDDVEKFHDEEFRLRDFCNVKKKGEKYSCSSTSFEEFSGKKIIHWLPNTNDLVDITVIMPDNTEVIGKGEPACKTVSVGDVIQFERFGFARLDVVEENKFTFCFAHK